MHFYSSHWHFCWKPLCQIFPLGSSVFLIRPTSSPHREYQYYPTPHHPNLQYYWRYYLPLPSCPLLCCWNQFWYAVLQAQVLRCRWFWIWPLFVCRDVGSIVLVYWTGLCLRCFLVWLRVCFLSGVFCVLFLGFGLGFVFFRGSGLSPPPAHYHYHQ